MELGFQFPGSDEKEAEPAEADKNVDFMWSVKIPMRDGVRLNATIYKPKDSEPVPAIFTLTPYIADSYHPRAYYFAKQGYAFAVVDCRSSFTDLHPLDLRQCPNSCPNMRLMLDL